MFYRNYLIMCSMPGIGCTVHYAQQLQIELIDYI